MHPRVVSVCLDLSPSHGGMYRAVTDLARMLGSPIVTFRDGTGVEPQTQPDLSVTVVDWSNLSTVRQAFFPPASVRRAAALALGNADCLLVHSLFRGHAQIVWWLAAELRIPYVVVPHGALEPALWKTRTVLRRAWMLAGGDRFLRDADRIVFATEGERVHAAQTLRHPLPATVIPFAVAAVESPLSAADKAVARRRLALPLDRRLLLALGRLDPVKQPAAIVRGFCAAAPPRCDLVFAGMDGAVTADALRRLVPPEMRDRVWFLGGLNSARRDEALAACDGYLCWSRHESFGYAAAESLAAGLPVILPAGHGLRSELEAVACGVFPPSCDHDALVGAVRTFAAWPDDALRSRGDAGRDWVRRWLCPAMVAEKWHELIAELSCRSGIRP